MGGANLLRAYKYRIYPTKEQEEFCKDFWLRKIHIQQNALR